MAAINTPSYAKVLVSMPLLRTIAACESRSIRSSQTNDANFGIKAIVRFRWWLTGSKVDRRPHSVIYEAGKAGTGGLALYLDDVLRPSKFSVPDRFEFSAGHLAACLTNVWRRIARLAA